MVQKKEGAEMTCKNCSTDLICRMKDYAGDFPSKLQWQNFDGSAHYSTSDGKNYSCNIPDGVVPEPPATTPGNTSPSSVNVSIVNSLEDIQHKLERMNEMIQAIFRDTVDRQLKKSEVEKEY